MPSNIDISGSDKSKNKSINFLRTYAVFRTSLNSALQKTCGEENLGFQDPSAQIFSWASGIQWLLIPRRRGHVAGPSHEERRKPHSSTNAFVKGERNLCKHWK